MLILDFVEKRFDILEQNYLSEAKIMKHVKGEMEAQVREERANQEVLKKEISVILKVKRVAG